MDERIRELIADFNQHVNNTEWFTDFKGYLNNFEKQLGLLDEQKEEFFEKTNKACQILNQVSPAGSPKRVSAKNQQEANLNEELPTVNYSKKFAKEVTQTKRKTDFNYHRSKIPFDISSVPQATFEGLYMYF